MPSEIQGNALIGGYFGAVVELHEILDDGAGFVDVDGIRSAAHPDLAGELELLLTERNATAAEHNAEVARILDGLETEAEAYRQLLVLSAGEGATTLD